MLKIVTYQGKRPSADQIKTDLIKAQPYTYIVATKSLERDRGREDLLPSHQTPQLSRQEKPFPIAVFHELMRDWVGRTIKISSRGDEKTMINRSIKRVADQDEHLKNVLKQDVGSWGRALADLASDGYDLTGKGSKPFDKQPVNPFVGELLVKLQQEYYQELSANNKHLFEKEAREQLPNLAGLIKPLVIMEGFTFLTPLQRYFVDVCHKQFHYEVVFLVPYNEAQKKGFECIDTTYFNYPEYKGMDHIHWTNKWVSRKEDLQALQAELFGNPFLVKESPDQSVELIRYPTRDREILSSIDTLRRWFDGRYKPNEVAIVVRSLSEFKERFQDFLHSAQLMYVNQYGEKIPVKVQTSSRLLLLTPVGRFILTLYDIWKENALVITNEQFENVLSSGWLGAAIQDSTIPFRAVKHQYFLHCESENDWITAMNDLENIVDTQRTVLSDRMPIQLVERQDIKYWRQTILLLKEICTRLFQMNQHGIGTHIKILQDQLNLLEVENIRKYEQDVLVKIQEVFTELETVYSLDLTVSEFGEALHALVSHKQEEDDEDGSTDTSEDTIWITSPEGIDGMERKAILYIGADNQHVPAKLPMSWPFFEDGREEHLQKERYMFLTVVRAASEHLTITCCRNDGNRVLQPSVYMLEIERLLNRKIHSPKTAELIDASDAPEFIDSFHNTPLRNRTFRLTELVQYGLCPLRYSFEKRHREARVYRNDWQLEVFAQGVWMDKTFASLTQYYGPQQKTRGIDAVYDLFCRAMNYVEAEVRNLFPSFDAVTMHGIKQRIQSQFDYYSKRGDYDVHFEKGQGKTIQLLMPGEHQQVLNIEVEIPYYMVAGVIRYPLLDTISSYEWLLPGKKEEDDEDQKQNEDEIMLFSSLYEARLWWRKTIEGALAETNPRRNRIPYLQEQYAHYVEAQELLLQWTQGIWNNKFPANIGSHCKVCPVRTECLGVEMEGTFF